MNDSVLIIEDDAELASVLSRALQIQGFNVETVGTGQEGIARCRQENPDLVILDFDLPDLNGQKVCREIRTFSENYIVMLTGRSSENDKVVSLTLGADDYITKPFSFNELVARLQAMMRRPHLSTSKKDREIGPIIIDFNTRSIQINGIDIELTRTEFDLLDCLTQQPGALVSRRDLLSQVWSTTWAEDDHMIDVHMHKLRKKLETAGASKNAIATIRGVGFRFQPQ